jgi:3-methyladenine DNA glycosylase Mpg
LIALIALVISVGSLFFNWRSMQAATRAAHAAEEQTKIQRQLRLDAAQPYVWADIRPDDGSGTLLNVVVGNSGPTVAEKVRVKVDPPLPAINQLQERVKIARTILADGIESLPPGRTLTWPLGRGSC